MSATVFRFSHCEVDTGARELRVAGRLQPLQPRPFDLLVLLLRHRHRDVQTSELLDRLWRDEFVAPGSVANAVAKVRRAIGDGARAPLIRTRHRRGYRFVGDVVEVVPSPTPQVPARSGPAPVTLALLPFQNLTGNPGLDWMALGLMSQVCRALSQEERLAPLPVPVVVAALQRCPAEADADARAHTVQQVTGARHVLQTRIHPSRAGYRLEYRLLDATEQAPGSLQADDLADLGRKLARQLVAQWFPGEPPPARQESSHDPWAMEVLARAMEATASRQWQRAAQLLAVVVDIEPRHPTAQLELLQSRARVHEAHGRFGAALDLWREATSRAQAAGQRAQAVCANGRAALAAAMCGLREEALRRAREDLAQAHAGGDHDELCRRTAQLCQVHTMLGLSLPPLPFADAAEPAASTEDARAAWWAVRGHALAEGRDHHAAARCFDRAVTLYRLAGAAGREAAMLMWWLDCLLRAGRLAEADEVLKRAEACSGGHGLLLRGLPWFRARVLNGHRDRPGALAALAPTINGPALDLGHAAACGLAAHWLLREGRIEEAGNTLALVNPGLAQHPLVSGVVRAAQAAGPG
jgi:DNA-binding winged helix-turn-helix (wHTH) protein/tetratricopeptide (TPR) repeat protein